MPPLRKPNSRRKKTEPPPQPQTLKDGQIAVREEHEPFYGSQLYKKKRELFTIKLYSGGELVTVNGLRVYKGGRIRFIDGVDAYTMTMESMCRLFYNLGMKEYYLYFYRRPGESLEKGIVNLKNDDGIPGMLEWAVKKREIDVFLIELVEAKMKKFLVGEMKELLKLSRANGLDNDEAVEVLVSSVGKVSMLEWENAIELSDDDDVQAVEDTLVEELDDDDVQTVEEFGDDDVQ